MNYLLPETAYKVLKWFGLIACPALAVLYGTVGAAWGWAATEQVVITINAVGVCVGALIGISAGAATEAEGEEAEEGEAAETVVDTEAEVEDV